jgi:N-acetylglucosaminyl-diphospho-decaprenol L-rhamnosyltransferase
MVCVSNIYQCTNRNVDRVRARKGDGHHHQRSTRRMATVSVDVTMSSAEAIGGVDVVIVAYRNWELTSSCLECLRQQTILHNVYLCDNGCDEGTAERTRAVYPEVTLLRMPRNMTYGMACNAAIAAGHGEIVVMINNDVDAREDFLERLVAPFALQPSLGSVAPLLLRPGEQQIDSLGVAADSTLSCFQRYKNLPVEHARLGDEAELVLSAPDGAAAAFRRVAWQQVEGMDERIEGSMDDLDLFLRMRAAGWRTAAAVDAVAVHLGSATLGHRSADHRRGAGFGRGYLLRCYGVLRSRATLRALVTEVLVVVADALLSRDFAALAGRWAGWRAASDRLRRSWPPSEAIDFHISFIQAIRLRRLSYMR